jgi:hypothetical protein
VRLDSRFLGWGVFFIVAGGLALAVRSGVIPPDSIAQLWRLWPLVLVGIGLGILLGRTSLAWLGGIIVAATFGVLVGSALAGGIDRVGCTSGSNAGGTTVSGQLTDGATVTIESACGPVTVSTAAGSGWSLTYRGDPPPVVEQAADHLRVASPRNTFLQQASWDVVLPGDPRLTLAVTASAGTAQVRLSNAHLASFQGTFNAGSYDVDLSGASVGGVSMTVNAGKGTLRLPTAALDGDIAINAGSLTLCVAPDAALRIEAGGALSSTDFSDAGLQKGDDGEWRTPGVDTAAAVIHLSLDANAASVTLRRDGGCA